MLNPASNVWNSRPCMGCKLWPVMGLLMASGTGVFALKGIADPLLLRTTEAFFISIPKESITNGSFQTTDQVKYLTSVSGMADLPDWIFYRYSTPLQTGFLYGSPVVEGDVDLEVIAMNQLTYETFRDTMRLRVIGREKRAKFEVELKFSNLDVEDMFQANRMKAILDIFSQKLWKDSDQLYVTRVVAPIDVGGRLPLDPKDKEGVIVRIGSTDNFSQDLWDLAREVDRLKNRTPCPRKYKATTAEYLFHQNHDFQNDWCSFRLIQTRDVFSPVLRRGVPPNIDSKPIPLEILSVQPQEWKEMITQNVAIDLYQGADGMNGTVGQETSPGGLNQTEVTNNQTIGSIMDSVGQILSNEETGIENLNTNPGTEATLVKTSLEPEEIRKQQLFLVCLVIFPCSLLILLLLIGFCFLFPFGRCKQSINSNKESDGKLFDPIHYDAVRRIQFQLKSYDEKQDPFVPSVPQNGKKMPFF